MILNTDTCMNSKAEFHQPPIVRVTLSNTNEEQTGTQRAAGRVAGRAAGRVAGRAAGRVAGRAAGRAAGRGAGSRGRRQTGV